MFLTLNSALMRQEANKYNFHAQSLTNNYIVSTKQEKDKKDLIKKIRQSPLDIKIYQQDLETKFANKSSTKKHDKFKKYSCCICFDLSLDPYECRNCEQIICGDCSNSILRSSNKCPYKCTGTFKENVKGVNRIIHEEIRNL